MCYYFLMQIIRKGLHTVELYQLRSFVAVAKLENMSQAAEQLHISQPALSRTITKLESELETKLFDRAGKHLALNECGRSYLHDVERVLQDLDEAAITISAKSAPVCKRLTIGVFGAQDDAISCMVAFMKANPDVQVDFDARHHTTTAKTVREFDLMFYPRSSAFEGIAGAMYGRNQTIMMVPRTSKMLAIEGAELIDFRDEPFIFTNTTAGMYEQAFRYCLDSGFTPQVRAIVSSGVAQMRLIEAGVGIGFTETASSKDLRRVHVISLKNSPSKQALCIACKPDRMMTPISRRFRDFTLSFLKITDAQGALARFEDN